MSARVAIVEDEMLVACHLESVIEDLGHCPIGIAVDSGQARLLADCTPDIALVDLNLRDGLTGPEIGAYLGARGIVVLFVTANPDQVSPPIPGAIGVLSKPCDDRCMEDALNYAIARRSGRATTPPRGFRAF